MPSKAFLMLEGIRGDARTAPWTGWIPIESVSFDPNVRGGTQKPVVVATLGGHSPHVAAAAANGRSFGKGAIVLVSEGQAFAELEMPSIFISGYRAGNGHAGLPAEVISLDPGTFKATFHQKTAMANPSTLQRGWQVA